MGLSTKGTSPAGASPTGKVQFGVGVKCMLNVTGRHFLVKILDLGSDTVRVSFPGKDYPVEGMRGELEFHDEDGFFYYHVSVVEGPVSTAPGILLRRAAQLERSKHRDSCRVPTDLTAQVKDEAHVRHYNADVLNLGAGGALVQTEATFDYSTTVELTVSLPGEATHTMRCQVVEVIPSTGNVRPQGNRYCLRFIEPDPDAEECITRYVWDRLHQMYPSE